MKFIKKNDVEYWVNGNGEMCGEFKAWHENGKIWTHRFYVEGEWHGEYKSWYDDGQIGEHCFYERDEIVRDFIIDPFTCDEEKFEFALMHEG